MADDLTLVPEYKFEWDDDTTRTTSDDDAFADDPSPDAVEALAEMCREDDSCEVTLLGMGG